MSLDTDRIRRAIGSKAGQRTAKTVGGVSLAALLGLAAPEYFRLRDAMADVAILKAKVEKLEAGSKTKWEHIAKLEENQIAIKEKLMEVKVRLESRIP